MSRQFDFERLVELCRRTHEETRQAASRAIDRSLVVRNWLLGRYIVEYEQEGANRAEYGSQILRELSAALKVRIGRGFSVDALERMRRFYLGYKHILSDVPATDNSAIPFRISATAHDSQTPSANSGEPSEIQQTPSVESPEPSLIGAPPNLTKLAARFQLGWSHYVTLLSLDIDDVRRFYEIEAADSGWSVRELKRQMDSALYERLALSRDKHEVRRLAREGQVVEKASDLIKDPVVLEFLGLDEKPTYSESDLETAIIDRLQQFLLELGKGFLFEAHQKRFSSDDSQSWATRCSTTACCGATC